MSSNDSFSFDSFVLVNTSAVVTGYDYLHTMYKSLGLADDFILWFIKLIWPEFKMVDGLAFVSDMFDDERYQMLLKDGHDAVQAQYWMNLLEITGLFDGLSTENATSVAETLAETWNSKLKIIGGASLNTAKVVYDDETGEVFVTIDSTE